MSANSCGLTGAVLFDFGGTLDADGLPWKERVARLFRQEGLVVTVERFDPLFYAADDALVGAVPPTLPLRETVFRLVAGLAPGPATWPAHERPACPTSGWSARPLATGSPAVRATR